MKMENKEGTQLTHNNDNIYMNNRNNNNFHHHRHHPNQVHPRNHIIKPWREQKYFCNDDH
jgi:hypothetical protein